MLLCQTLIIFAFVRIFHVVKTYVMWKGRLKISRLDQRMESHSCWRKTQQTLRSENEKYCTGSGDVHFLAITPYIVYWWAKLRWAHWQWVQSSRQRAFVAPTSLFPLIKIIPCGSEATTASLQCVNSCSRQALYWPVVWPRHVTAVLVCPYFASLFLQRQEPESLS